MLRPKIHFDNLPLTLGGFIIVPFLRRASVFDPKSSPFSFKVQHECFGRCEGLVLPEAYTSPTARYRSYCHIMNIMVPTFDNIGNILEMCAGWKFSTVFLIWLDGERKKISPNSRLAGNTSEDIFPREYLVLGMFVSDS